MGNAEVTSLGGRDARFPPTLWSQVLSAKDLESPEHRGALEELIRRYWKPVYAYVRFQWSRDNESAKDLTQAFFTALLEKDGLAGVAPEKGRFRSFLKASLKHFLANAKRDQGRLKRGGGRAAVPFEEAGEVPGGGPDPAATAEEAFDRAWRSGVLQQALDAVRVGTIAAGKEIQWRAFAAAVLDDAEPRPVQEEVARRLGISLTDLTNHLHAVRKRLRETLRVILADGLAQEIDLDTEWKDVLRIRGR